MKRNDGEVNRSTELTKFELDLLIQCKNIKVHDLFPQKPKGTQPPSTTPVKSQWLIEPLPYSNLDVSQLSVWRLHAVREEDGMLVLVCDCSKVMGEEMSESVGGRRMMERNFYDAGKTEFQIPKFTTRAARVWPKGRCSVTMEGGASDSSTQLPSTDHPAEGSSEIYNI